MKLVNQQEKVLTSIGVPHPARWWHQWMNMPICHFCAIWKKKTMFQRGQTLPTGRPKELHRTRSAQVTFISAHQPGEIHAKKNFWLTLFSAAERERSEVPELVLCLCHYKISAINNTYSHFQFPFSANFRHADVFRELRTCRFVSVCVFVRMECLHIRGR